MEQLTDEQLVEVVRRGEREAYRVLVERHKQYVFTLVLRSVDHRETAEDLAQEVFLKLYRSLELFRGDSKFTTWLYRMTVNMVTDYRRTQARRPVENMLDKVKDWAGSRREQPEAQAVLREERRTMQELVQDLPDKYRMVIYLYHFRQLTYQEIAQVLQLPIKTVETRLYRGKALLKEKWLEVYGDELQTNSAQTAR
jgi:RNA polymerase sigma factor (sigma-70 family)